MNPEIQTFTDPQAWRHSAADLIYRRIGDAVAVRGRAALALAGGRTPQPLYEHLGRNPYTNTIPWSAVHLFWGDERCVPVTDPDSNYGMARRTFLDALTLTVGNLHPVPVQPGKERETAELYEADLRRFFTQEAPKAEGPLASFPRFDLILLGLGPDGHTASLFPGDAALAERKRWVAWVPEAPLPPRVPRITLTLPVINRARTVLFLVSGKDKKVIIEKVRADGDNPDSLYPAARIRPEGELIWMVLS